MAGLCVTGGGLALPRAARATDDAWVGFKRRYIVDDARVVDVGNKGVSHSEGQGWGMLFAEYAGDRPTFERLWQWTQASLRRPDGHFSWRWTPEARDPVADKNNAADGDLLIAWALARAGRRWNEPAWRAQSTFIAAALLNNLTVEVGGRLVLLPGIDGFRRTDGVVVNLSYYVWPALAMFAEASGDPRWKRLATEGQAVLDKAAFGAHRLPPDWLLLGPSGSRIAPGWPPQFGYEAVRIPLYLAWSGDRARLARFIDAWQATLTGGRPPAFIDLESGALPGYTASGGYAAVFELAQRVSDGRLGPLDSAGLSADDDYYSASLKLLSAMAIAEAPMPR